MARNQSINEILLQKNFVTQAQLDDAVRWQRTHPNEKIADILMSRGIVDEYQVLRCYAEALGLRFLENEIVVLRPEILKTIPEAVVNKHGVMPMEVRGNKIIIAVSDPHDMAATEDIKMVSKKDVEIVLCTKQNIENAIEKYYTNAGSFFISDDAAQKTIQSVSAETQKKMSEIESRADNTPVVKLINSLVQQAYARQASDIHIEPFAEQVLVRMRIDGDLVEVMRMGIESHSAIVSRVKILSGINIAEKRIPQDGRFDYDVDGIKVDMRVSTLPTVYGEKVNMRLLATGEAKSIRLNELGMKPALLKEFEKQIHAPNGIILVTGPTGSGKSTTLYAVLAELNQPNVNITTVEDPVEKQIFGVNQVQTNAKAGLTFAAGLRSILRQDPDIVMIGEIRDEETGSIAIRAAITGHLVLSTLHTNDSVSSIVRLVDIGIPNYMVASAVNCVIAQRLVRKLCPDCKVKREIRPEEAAALNRDNIKYVYDAKGCPRCGNTGYKGRTAIYELVELTPEIRQMVTKNATTEELRDFAHKKGFTFLADSCAEYIEEGVTSMSEFYRLIFSI